MSRERHERIQYVLGAIGGVAAVFGVPLFLLAEYFLTR